MSDKARRSHWRAWLGVGAGLSVVLAALALSAFVRLRVADTPLERDEGEYAYAGQLIRQGVPPYRLAYNMKFPGVYYSYALAMTAFGETPRGIRTGLLVVNAAAALLVFGLSRRLLGTPGGTAAAVCFVLLSLDRWVLGVFGHATHFVLVPVLAAFWVLYRREGPPGRAACLVAGVLLGLGVIMKQHAVLYLPLGAAVLIARRAARRLPLLAAGAAVPFAVLVAVLAAYGVLSKFWFWTFRYALEYVKPVPLAESWGLFGATIAVVTRATIQFWLLAAAGLVALFTARFRPGARFLLPALLVTSFLTVLPRQVFREHYFILMLPALAILTGGALVALARVATALVPRVPAGAVGAALLFVLAASYVWPEREYLFSQSPRELSRTRFGSNPFVEMEQIAGYVRARTAAADRVVVIGSEPQTFFYSGRRSATGTLYVYPLVERQVYAARMTEETIREIESARAKYLLLVMVPPSWGTTRPDSPIFRWAVRYAREHYDLAGIADIWSGDETTFTWGAAVARYRPQSTNLIYIYRLRE